MGKLREPKWTVMSKIISPENSQYVGTSWEFFYDAVDAGASELRHISNGDTCIIRPFDANTDIPHMGDPTHINNCGNWVVEYFKAENIAGQTISKKYLEYRQTIQSALARLDELNSEGATNSTIYLQKR